MAFKDFIASMAKEIGGELVGEYFTIGAMKKILLKSLQKNQQQAPTGRQEPSASEIPKIRFGGLFDESDETAFLIGIAKLPKKDQIAVLQNLQALSKEVYRRRFRVAVSPLFGIEFTRKYHKTEKQTGWNKRKREPIIEKGVVEEKANFGDIFMKSFAKLSSDEAVALCKTAGICTTFVEQAQDSFNKIKRWAEHDGKQVAEEVADILSGINNSLEDRSNRRQRKPFWKNHR